MAEEANVENLLTREDKYYCHKCQVEVRNLLPGFQCPTCQYGFVELMEQPEHNEESDSSFSDVDDFHPVEMLSTILSSEFAGAHDDRPAGGRSRGSRRNRERMEPVENILQDLLLNLAGLGWAGQWGSQAAHLNMGNMPGGGTFRNTGGGPVLFLGNPGDYAWSREGLDAIVTQLLNQMDGTGPPPLAKDKIQKIPVAIITQDQVDSNLQCSVCWEDFAVNEQVRKLPCEHVYHSACIIPWLELHGTCPICRKTLSEAGDGAATVTGAMGAPVDDAANLGPLATFFRNLQDAGPGRSLSNAVLGSIAASSSPATTSPSSTSSSSSSSSSSTSSSSTSTSTRSNSSTERSGGTDMNWTMEYE